MKDSCVEGEAVYFYIRLSYYSEEITSIDHNKLVRVEDRIDCSSRWHKIGMKDSGE